MQHQITTIMPAEQPTIKPTRSRSTVMITKVIPTARIASAPRAGEDAMFATLRKLSTTSAKKTKTAKSAMKARAFQQQERGVAPEPGTAGWHRSSSCFPNRHPEVHNREMS